MKKQTIPSSVKKIWKSAVKAQKNAYSRYSKFPVGAAFQVGSKIYSGCNVENVSYGATICAEQTAIVKAVSEGKRKNYKDLVVVTKTKNAVSPCGRCLQMINEFCSPNLNIWIATPKKIHGCYKLKDLFPGKFSKADLKYAQKR